MVFSSSTGAGVARTVTAVSSIRAARHGCSRKGQRKRKTQRKCPGQYWSCGTELKRKKQENLEKRRKTWEMARRRGCTGKKTELEAQVKEGFMS